MKRKVTTSIYAPLRWLSLVVVMFVCAQWAFANTNTFYYNATATSSPQAAGKVYISDASTTNPGYQVGSHSTGNKNFRFIGNTGYVTLYMYAEPVNEFHLFQNWTYDGQVISTSPQYSTTVSINPPDQRKYLNFTANFLDQTGLIRVRSANPGRGSVTISNPDNKDEETVTLTAIPDASNGVLFEGWTKDNGTQFVSTDNPYVLVANSNTQGTYVAHFTEPAEKVFVRLQNKKTGRFISFYGDRGGDGTIAHYRTMSDQSRQDGFDFNKCWKLIPASEAQGNPETVFLFAGQSGGAGITWGADMSAHGKAYTSLIHEEGYSTNSHMLRMEKSGDIYRIFTTFTYSYKPLIGQTQTVTFNSYFCDEGDQGSGYLMMKSIDDLSDGSADWYVYALNENTTEGAFGANTKAKFTRDGKYYTTMFTDFPYKCIDGVTAYYLDIDREEFEHELEEHKVHFTVVPEGKVPAYMAVVLECDAIQNDFTSNKTVVNRLVPLTEDVPQIINPSLHFLKGYVSENNSKITNNFSTMYVLSVDDPSKENHLGFYHYSGANMTPNKAYLDTHIDVSNNPNAAQMTFVFGKDNEGNTNKIILHDMMVADEDAPIYDLLGRKITGILPKGIYIRNGKKFIVK